MRYDRFQWVACQLEELRKCRKPSQVTSILGTLPRTLNDAYDRALSSVDETLWEDVCKILVLVTYSFQPLPLDALAEATAIDLKSSTFDREDRMFDTSSICTMCPGLISPKLVASRVRGHPSNGERVMFNHFSIKEYLTSSNSRTGRAAQIPARAEAHSMIAEIYLTYLSGVLNFEGDMDRARIEKNFPLITYASAWTLHVDKAGSASEAVGKAVMTLVLSQNIWKNFNDYKHEGREELFTPLATACQARSTVLAQKLLDHGANVHKYYARDPVYWTVLSAAVMQGYSPMVELLLKNGAANTQDLADDAFCWAIDNGHLDCVKLLFHHGADITATNLSMPWGHKILLTAIRENPRGRLELVQFLLDHGANYIQPDGRDEMLEAVRRNRLDIAQVLFTRGIKVCVDALCAASLVDTALVQWLIVNGADVNLTRYYSHDGRVEECDGASILRCAAVSGLHAVAAILRKHGAVMDMNLRIDSSQRH